MKNNQVNRIVALLLAIACLLSFKQPILASSDVKSIYSNAITEAISRELEYIYIDQLLYDLADVDFQNIDIGLPINAYTYENGKLNICDFVFIPLFHKQNLFGFVMVEPVGERYIAQFTTSFVSQLENVNGRIAFLYDDIACYYYTEDSLIEIARNSETVSDRSRICNSTSFSNLSLTRLEAVEHIEVGGINQGSLRSNAYVSLNVSYVSRGYSNLSWAACVACVENYLDGNTLTATAVAQSVFQSTTNFNYTCGIDVIANCMLGYGWLGFYYNDTTYPSDYTIQHNINGGSPVVGDFSNSNNNRFCVIYGIDVLESRISVMNPVIGFMSAYKNISGVYQVRDSYTGTTYYPAVGYAALYS